MFNPELRYFIAEENGEVEPIIEQKLFENILDYGGVICTGIILSLIAYNKLSILTSVLTPGEEWIEMMLIIASIGFFIMFKLIADFVLNDLHASFDKLHRQIEEKDNKINTTEKTIVKLENTIVQLDNKNAQLEKQIKELNDKIAQLNDENENFQQENYELLRENDFLKHNLVEEIRQDDEEIAKLEERITKSYITTDLFEDKDNIYNKKRRFAQRNAARENKWEEVYLNLNAQILKEQTEYANTFYA